jgi:hypothetical protein
VESRIQLEGFAGDKGLDGPCRPAAIALISAVILLLELSFIRLIPAEVKAISYFTNLILMAAFFGMGIGCIIQKKPSASWLMPLGFVLVFLFVFFGRGIVIYDKMKEVHFWLGSDIRPSGMRFPLFPAAVGIFLFSALPFVPLGQSLARAMEPFPRLRAYAWNILGSLAGALIFTGASLLNFPPWGWPPILAAVWAFFFIKNAVKRIIIPVTGLFFIIFSQSAYQSRWSPYYYIQYTKNPQGIPVFVNSSFHQFAFDFTPPAEQGPQAERELLVRETLLKKWNRPYDMYRTHHNGKDPEKVLVLGAGTGNDVYVALRNNAGKVVAVEIDPVILDIGKKLNRSKPFHSDRVTAVVDDARHYMSSSAEKFDMIVFGTLDSQSLLSSSANLRLENYVYTTESLRDARALLNDRGMVAVHYSVAKPWLWGRIYSTLRLAFGDQSMIFIESDETLFNTTLVAAKGISGLRDNPENIGLFGGRQASTDNWPFIYLEHPTIAALYLNFILVMMILISGVFILHRRVHRITGSHANYFFLGVGFTLMESSAIVRLALLFGSTWVINAVVFSSVLLTVFLANLLVIKKKNVSLGLSWALLIAFIIINYLFPVSCLFKVGALIRTIASGLLIGLPVFFASTCFSILFSEEETTGYPLGINLIGAMSGGFIEYSSMIIGMRGVWFVILVIYCLAFISTRSIRKHGAAATA